MSRCFALALAVVLAWIAAPADSRAGQIIVQYEITSGTLSTFPTQALTGGSFRIAFPASGPSTFSATPLGGGLAPAYLQSFRVTAAANGLELVGSFAGSFSLPPIGPLAAFGPDDVLPDDPALLVRTGPALSNTYQLFTSTLSVINNLFGTSVQVSANFRLFRPGDDLYLGVDLVGQEVSRVYVASELSPTVLLALGGALAGGAVALRRRSRPQSFLVR